MRSWIAVLAGVIAILMGSILGMRIMASRIDWSAEFSESDKQIIEMRITELVDSIWDVSISVTNISLDDEWRTWGGEMIDPRENYARVTIANLEWSWDRLPPLRKSKTREFLEFRKVRGADWRLDRESFGGGYW